MSEARSAAGGSFEPGLASTSAMLGKLRVLTTDKPCEPACLNTSGDSGVVLTITRSPPSNWRACKLRADLIRSTKNPTLAIAATATTSAAASNCNSPARQSRRRKFQDNRIGFI